MDNQEKLIRFIPKEVKDLRLNNKELESVLAECHPDFMRYRDWYSRMRSYGYTDEQIQDMAGRPSEWA